MAQAYTLITPISLTAGTGLVASSSQIFASTVVFQAGPSNTSGIYIGPSGVTATNGIALATSATYTDTFDTVFGANGKIDLSTIFFASDTTGNKVRIMYKPWSGG